MGYTTEFSGRIEISPPLDQNEIDFINKFSGSRRMARKSGPYTVVDDGNFGQTRSDDIIDYNRPPEGQPGLWCQWVPTDDGTALEWDGSEKFYNSEEWMTYLIDHFLRPAAIAQVELPFLQANHTLNGVIKAQGEEMDDRWKLVVTDNVVTTQPLE